MSKRPIHQYTEEQLSQAMTAIRNGMKIREASRAFSVPRGTLQDRLHLRVPEVPRKMGPSSILTREEETALKDWCIALAECGFPLKSDDLLNTVHSIISEENRPNPFLNNRPGKKWYQSFLRRNPELSERTPENISKGRAVVTEEGIRKWFGELLKHLEEKNASDILTMPDRIFNGDETSFYICPKSGKVIAPRGYKNVYKIVKGKEKEAVTVLAFISASGQTLPPCVVFPYVRPPKDVINSMPAGWLLGKSETGWMKSDIFFDYIVKGLNKWVEDQGVQKPILVFVDGHKSHLTMRLSQYCNENGIILYALPPNATHLIQPADVSVFKPLKSEWKNTVHEWATQPQNVNNVLTKATFCPLLEKVLGKENLPVIIRNGFRKCGLYPYNPNALDYSKCVQNNLERHQNLVAKNANLSGNKMKNRDLNTALKVINQLSNELENAGIDVKTVVSVLKIAKDTLGTESLNSTKNSLNSTKNSTSDAVRINNLSSISHTDIHKTQTAIESIEIPDISLPIVGDYTLENNLCDSHLTDSNILLGDFEIITSFEIVDPQHSQKIQESEVIALSATHEDDNGDKKRQKKENAPLNSDKHSKTDDVETKLIIDQNSIKNMYKDIPAKSNDQQENNKQNSSNESHKNSKEKPVILSNVVIKPGNLSPILKKHLTLPSISNRTKTLNSINRIGAISSDEWRQFEKQKEEAKEQKKNDIILRKIKRLEAKEKKEIEMRKKKEQLQKKRKAEKLLNLKHNKKQKKNMTTTENKIRCYNCEEEMTSDTEINDYKNVGCDSCPAWYHLKCTEFAGELYENVCNKHFQCQSCINK